MAKYEIESGKMYRKDMFCRLVAERAGFTVSDVKIIYDAMVKVIVEIVQKQATLKLKNFFTIVMQHLPERDSYSGLYKKPIHLPACTRLHFKVQPGFQKIVMGTYRGRIDSAFEEEVEE